MRWVAKNVVAAGPGPPLRGAGRLRHRRRAPGRPVRRDLRHRHRAPTTSLEKAISSVFDLRPGAIVRDLDLLRPIYAPTAAYGHFGRTDVELPWERLDRVEALRRSAVGRRLTALDTPAPPGDPGSRRTAGGPGRRRRAAGAPGPAVRLRRPGRSSPSTVQAGCRVRVRFAGQLRRRVRPGAGRRAPTSPASSLPLAHVPSGEPVLTPQVARLARAVADRYAGTMSDVLRLAVPPRRARRREAADADARTRCPAAPDPAGFARYPAGPALLDRRWPRAAPPGRSGRRCPGRTGPPGWSSSARRRCPDGRGALVVVPDGRDLDRLAAAADAAAARRTRSPCCAPTTRPEKRYRQLPRRLPRERPRWCSAPAAAMFAPGARPRPGGRLGRRRRPARRRARALSARPRRAGPAGLPGQLRRRRRRHRRAPPRRRCWSSPAGRTSWSPTGPSLRAAAPRVQALGDDFELARDPAARSARLPSLAHEAARQALAAGRAGARAGAAARLRARRWPAPAAARPARCAHCAGPLGISPRPGPGRRADPGLPLVRPAGGHLRLPALPRHQAAGRRGRGVPDRRGARRGPSRAPRCARPAARSGVLATVPGGPVARRRHAGGRAGRRGRLRRGAAAGLLGAARPGRPAGGGGDAAPLDERGGARAARVGRRAGRRRRRRRAPRRPGAGALGPGVAGRARARRPARAGLPAGHPDRVAVRLAGGAGRVPGGAAAARGRRPARPGARAAAAGPGGRAGALPGPGAARARARRWPTRWPRCRACAAPRRSPEHVRVQLDPLDLV